MKPRLELLPWDVVHISDHDLPSLVGAARMWWLRETEQLPCLVPSDMVMGVGAVLAHGAAKHSERGWENEEWAQTASYHFGALMRHVMVPGPDAESGLDAQWHAACRYMMLSALLARGDLIDDRPPARAGAQTVAMSKGGVS